MLTRMVSTLLVSATVGLTTLAAPVPRDQIYLDTDLMIGEWSYSWHSMKDGWIIFREDGTYISQHEWRWDTWMTGKWYIDRKHNLVLEEQSRFGSDLDFITYKIRLRLACSGTVTYSGYNLESPNYDKDTETDVKISKLTKESSIYRNLDKLRDSLKVEEEAVAAPPVKEPLWKEVWKLIKSYFE